MKKWILASLVAIIAVCSASALAACTYEESGHNWSKKWSHDERNHWHECLDDDCSLRGELASHGWSLKSTTESPTCDREGEGKYECTVCGEEKVGSIPATGDHVWKKGDERAPTCYLAGFRITSCVLCGKQVKEEIPATGNHEYDEEVWLSAGPDGHYHPCKTQNCNKVTELIPHNVSDDPIKTDAPEQFKDGVRYYGCSDCGYITREESVSPTNIPQDLEVELTPVNITLEGTLAGHWPNVSKEPKPLIVKVSDGVYNAVVVRDTGTIDKPEYPYAISFTGLFPLQNERDKVPVWGMGSTYGINAYNYKTDTQNRTLLTSISSPMFYDGFMRFRISADTVTVQFVFQTADNADKTNLQDRVSIIVNFTVVPYGTSAISLGGTELILDTTPVIFIDANARKRVGI